jgi:hypothetical protein
LATRSALGGIQSLASWDFLVLRGFWQHVRQPRGYTVAKGIGIARCLLELLSPRAPQTTSLRLEPSGGASAWCGCVAESGTGWRFAPGARCGQWPPSAVFSLARRPGEWFLHALIRSKRDPRVCPQRRCSHNPGGRKAKSFATLAPREQHPWRGSAECPSRSGARGCVADGSRKIHDPVESRTLNPPWTVDTPLRCRCRCRCHRHGRRHGHGQAQHGANQGMEVNRDADCVCADE